MGVAWKILAALGVPALTVALGLWRDVALQAAEIATLRSDATATRATIAEHVASDRQARDAAADRERDAAVASARIAAALEAAKGQIDALLAALSRRRPG